MRFQLFLSFSSSFHHVLSVPRFPPSCSRSHRSGSLFLLPLRHLLRRLEEGEKAQQAGKAIAQESEPRTRCKGRADNNGMRREISRSRTHSRAWSTFFASIVFVARDQRARFIIPRALYRPCANCAVYFLAFDKASASFFFHRSATSFASGSSGLGAESKAWMLRRTVRI